MDLSYEQLRKRDVVNVADGRCFGRITDLTLSFPKGVMTGITVPARKRRWFLKFFDRNSLFIPERNILKIGGDVILVDLRCGETCETSVNLNKPQNPPKPPSPQPRCCSDPCSPPVPDIPSRADLEDY